MLAPLKWEQTVSLYHQPHCESEQHLSLHLNLAVFPTLHFEDKGRS